MSKIIKLQSRIKGIHIRKKMKKSNFLKPEERNNTISNYKQTRTANIIVNKNKKFS